MIGVALLVVFSAFGAACGFMVGLSFVGLSESDSAGDVVGWIVAVSGFLLMFFFVSGMVESQHSPNLHVNSRIACGSPMYAGQLQMR